MGYLLAVAKYLVVALFRPLLAWRPENKKSECSNLQAKRPGRSGYGTGPVATAASGMQAVQVSNNGHILSAARRTWGNRSRSRHIRPKRPDGPLELVVLGSSGAAAPGPRTPTALSHPQAEASFPGPILAGIGSRGTKMDSAASRVAGPRSRIGWTDTVTAGPQGSFVAAMTAVAKPDPRATLPKDPGAVKPKDGPPAKAPVTSETGQVDNATSFRTRTVKNGNSGEVLLEDVSRKDLVALQSHLLAIGALLLRDPKAFEPNAMIMVMGAAATALPKNLLVDKSAESHTRVGNATEGSDAGITLLGSAARFGWLPGVTELLEWDRRRKDSGTRIRVDEPGAIEGPNALTPLLLAAQAGHADVVRYLLAWQASVTVQDKQGLTPLELAASAGSSDMVAALLSTDNELVEGLSSIRIQLAQDAVQLPSRAWTLSASKQASDAMDRLRRRVPAAFRPTIAERSVAGEKPSDWVLYYKNRVMHALAGGEACRGVPAAGSDVLLAQHGYDTFARDFSFSFLVLSLIMGFFGILSYVAFRLRAYGSWETPVSLADAIPGAFNPKRLTDPDFDPSRQAARMPYQQAKDHLEAHTPPASVGSATFAQAILGIFSSWLLLCVRILPEKDAYDEDYLSDDDEKCREQMRERCAARAHSIRNVEVSIRMALFLVLNCWLFLAARRWTEASLLLLLYVYHAWIVSSVASNVAPGSQMEPKHEPDDQDTMADDASIVNALFSVQDGPRWVRAMSTTRSSARHGTGAVGANTGTSAGFSKRRERRPRRGGSDNEQGGKSASRRRGRKEQDAQETLAEAGTEAAPARGAQAAGSPSASSWGLETASNCSGSESAVSDSNGPRVAERFRRSLLESGAVHVSHRSFLLGSLASILTISLTLLWLSHIRRLVFGSFRCFYGGLSPSELFLAYGTPGSFDRTVALTLYFLLLWFAGERVYGISSLLRVAALSLQQRVRALAFAVQQRPPWISQKEVPKDTSTISDAMHHIDEYTRTCEFALDLSGTRWLVLREPVLVVYLCTLKFLAAAIITLAVPLVGPVQHLCLARCMAFDPALPLCVGLCMVGPLGALLAAATQANREVAQQRIELHQCAELALETVLTSGKDIDDVEYVHLRVKACEALQAEVICWPGGRELGVAEPTVLLVMSLAAVGAAIVAAAFDGGC